MMTSLDHGAMWVKKVVLRPVTLSLNAKRSGSSTAYCGSALAAAKHLWAAW